MPQLARPAKQTTLKAFRQEQIAAMNTTGVYDPRNNVATHRVQPDSPIKALDRRKEGMVALSFMIEADGSVGDVEVVDTVAGYMFQRPSLSAMRQWEFEPRVRDGKRVRSPACHEFIFPSTNTRVPASWPASAKTPTSGPSARTEAAEVGATDRFDFVTCSASG